MVAASVTFGFVFRLIGRYVMDWFEKDFMCICQSEALSHVSVVWPKPNITFGDLMIMIMIDMSSF